MTQSNFEFSIKTHTYESRESKKPSSRTISISFTSLYISYLTFMQNMQNINKTSRLKM